MYGTVGEIFVDDDTRTCLTLQKLPQDGTFIQTSLFLNNGCRNGSRVNLNITVKEQTQCNGLLGMILIEKPTTTCSKAVKCEVISSVIAEGSRVCGIGCPCADSGNQCLIHLVNEINVEICELITTMLPIKNRKCPGYRSFET